MIESDSKKNFYKTTGGNIKKYRDIRNYSLQVLAEKVGLTKKTIHRYESGDIKIDMDRLKDLSIALDVSVSQLTEGTDVFQNEKNPDPLANEKELVSAIVLSDEATLNDSVIIVDGVQLTDRQKKKLLAMVRLDLLDAE